MLAPALGFRTLLQACDVGVRQAAFLGDQLVLGELVLGLVQPADAQDEELAVAERQALLAEHVAGERRPALHELRMMGQHLEDVEHLTVHGVLLDDGAVLGGHGRQIAERDALLALDHRLSSFFRTGRQSKRFWLGAPYSLATSRSATTAPSTITPPIQAISVGTSPNASQTSAGASGVSRAPIRADRGAEISRVPSVSSSRPRPNCKVPNRMR